MSRCNALEQDDNSAFRDSFPLKLHGVYTKAQIQVAIETSTLQKMSPSREGCERNTLNGIPMEAMFVDVIRIEKRAQILTIRILPRPLLSFTGKLKTQSDRNRLPVNVI